MMCAFMTPVLKNDWEIYPTKGKNNKQRSRNTSESSQRSLRASNECAEFRRRNLGEHRSMSYHATPSRSSVDPEFAYTRAPRSYHLSTRNSRNASRSSFSPTHNGHHLMTVSEVDGKTTQNSITKFHTKVFDKLKNVLQRKNSTKSEDHDDDEECETKRG